eukprot:TRINITY_DN30475_c0_g1_i1.p1 TRINITY_DN30475_c0_g1~~TRINITY_DN30475_c0_g1_i1.p1  ORF type:complete len:492 (+),score=65.40 TRINITY_DN30475_c0_g1_i1:78-1553(+)
MEHFDVVVIGAGISGIDAGYHLKRFCPQKTFVILERRSTFGGTWDLFRYPGIRSDSDMPTFGYSWKPWRSSRIIAPGEEIIAYLREAVQEVGLARHLRYNSHVVSASWTSEDARWTLQLEGGAAMTCSFLFGCTGYYNYDEAYQPEFKGQERFLGRIVHPQWWTPDIDYTKKRVAVIGSGATAVTLIPTLALDAEHVTMVQRSPTYIVAQPPDDAMYRWLQKVASPSLLHQFVRGKNILLGNIFFKLSRRFPSFFKSLLLKGVQGELQGAMSPEDIDRHFTPRYNPWDQRLCLSPAGDFFDCFRKGKASVVTDQIETFTEKGLLLSSGQEVEADLVVTATGLKLQHNFPMSTMKITIDGREYVPPDTMVYKGVMLSGVPNFAFVVGYTNASWTLKADLACRYATNLLNHMHKHGHTSVWPTQGPDVQKAPDDAWPLTSGYVQRAKDQMPKTGDKPSWAVTHDYLADWRMLTHGPIIDDALRFRGSRPRSSL